MTELWSISQVAAYLKVSASRARAILAGRGIKRVSGYPADQVKAITLRQGARTDLTRHNDQDGDITKPEDAPDDGPIAYARAHVNDPQVHALLDEAERIGERRKRPERHRRESVRKPAGEALHAHEVAAADEALHAHEVTPDDAAMIRMMAGARFGPKATITLPSGKTISGAEMQRWIENNEARDD